MIEMTLDARWIWWGALLIGGVSLVFGIFTAFLPYRSIALYQWLMALINWRAAPIDEGREVRNTRFLGILLILLSVLLLGALKMGRI